jgi:hypothetical protein
MKTKFEIVVDYIIMGILVCIVKVMRFFGWKPRKRPPPWLTPAKSNKELERIDKQIKKWESGKAKRLKLHGNSTRLLMMW